MKQALEIIEINWRLVRKEIPYWKSLELIAQIRKRYESWEQLELNFHTNGNQDRIKESFTIDGMEGG